ncbi:uncharacterized protein LOC114716643 [Neltuma alba]|uniref:uncharacterized protein LOC114716643 n=1 Tax=Neltuma alba TaxID=207710 RepID=UPI0010A476CD|nr:uncharacterized protein LOC114716643 [Prosopis alba]XP_028757507.1 uncharacterized protein LOC114716643 [Prosopis alba]
MRGTGGPLLCIGDLLSDVGEEEDVVSAHSSSPSFSSSSVSDSNLAPDLTKLFQENYKHLNKALAGTDHSWTALTLKLCTALETANDLLQSTNSNVGLLAEKVGQLQRVVKRADSAITAAKALHVNLDEDKGADIDNAKFK